MCSSDLSRSIKGKVAIVTGAASGMGRATAHLFSDEGARVTCLDINQEPLDAVVNEIVNDGGAARGWQLDLSDGDAIVRVVAEIAEHFGGIDILVNNAGISIPAPVESDDYLAAWDKSLSVLLTAHVRMIQIGRAHV